MRRMLLAATTAALTTALISTSVAVAAPDETATPPASTSAEPGNDGNIAAPVTDPAAPTSTATVPDHTDESFRAGPSTIPTPSDIPAPAAIPAFPQGKAAPGSAIEPYPQYVWNNSCGILTRPGTVQLGQLLEQTYGVSGWGPRDCAWRNQTTPSDHFDGRAYDFFVTVRNSGLKAIGDSFVRDLLATDSTGTTHALARRMGVSYILWNNRRFSFYAPEKGWTDYQGCATRTDLGGVENDSLCHRDHIHISLTWAGAQAKTSYWTGSTAPFDFGPCKVSGMNWAPPRRTNTAYNGVRCGSQSTLYAPYGSDTRLQTLYKLSGQRAERGSKGPLTTLIQQEIGTTADGYFGAGTQSALKTWQATRGLTTSGATDAPTWRAILARKEPIAENLRFYDKYGTQVLDTGSTGWAVKAVQRELTRLGYYAYSVSGTYTTTTMKAVNAWKADMGLFTDGRMDAAAWKAMSEMSYPRYTSPERRAGSNAGTTPDLLTVKSGRLTYRDGSNARYRGETATNSGYDIYTTLADGRDLTGDGLNDLIGMTSAGTVYIVPGSGNGWYKSAQRYKIADNWSGRRIIGVGDVNSTGRGDIITVTSSGRASLHLVGSTGRIWKTTTLARGWDVHDLVAPGDVTGDGIPDLMTRGTSGTLYLRAGQADRTYARPVSVGAGFGVYSRTYGAGDITGDGIADLVSYRKDKRLYLHRGLGGGKYAAATYINWSSGAPRTAVR